MAIQYGRKLDVRDGKWYRTVLMPDGKWWLAENLAYVGPDSWDYDDNPANRATYGRLYHWQSALDNCIAGCHVPSDAEWSALQDTIPDPDGKKLKAASALWSPNSGTDDYGFALLPAGRLHGSSWQLIGLLGTWWSSTEAAGQEQNAWNRVAVGDQSNFFTYAYSKTDAAYSVRLIVDEGNIPDDQGDILPTAPFYIQQFIKAGEPLAGGKLYAFVAGTNDPAPIYADAAGASPAPNPLTLSADGVCPQFWCDPMAYRFTLTDSAGVHIATRDYIQVEQAPDAEYKVKVDAADPTAGYLAAKLTQGAGINLDNQGAVIEVASLGQAAVRSGDAPGYLSAKVRGKGAIKAESEITAGVLAVVLSIDSTQTINAESIETNSVDASGQVNGSEIATNNVPRIDGSGNASLSDIAAAGKLQTNGATDPGWGPDWRVNILGPYFAIATNEAVGFEGVSVAMNLCHDGTNWRLIVDNAEVMPRLTIHNSNGYQYVFSGYTAGAPGSTWIPILDYALSPGGDLSISGDLTCQGVTSSGIHDDGTNIKLTEPLYLRGAALADWDDDQYATKIGGTGVITTPDGGYGTFVGIARNQHFVGGVLKAIQSGVNYFGDRNLPSTLLLTDNGRLIYVCSPTLPVAEQPITDMTEVFQVDKFGNVTCNGVTIGTTPIKVRSFASIYRTAAGVNQSIPTGATYTKITPFDTNLAGNQNSTPDQANDEIVIGRDGVFEVHFSRSYQVGTANVIWHVAVLKNGVAVPNSVQEVFSASTATSYYASVSAHVQCAAGDKISIGVYHDKGAAVNLDYEHATLNVEAID